MAFDVHILHVRPNSTLKQRNIHLFRSERRLVTVLQIGRKLGQRVPAVLVCRRRVRCCRSRCRPMFVLTQSSNCLSLLANFRGLVLGRKEGRKEYRIILQKLKVPEVSPPILVKRKGRNVVFKMTLAKKIRGKKKNIAQICRGQMRCSTQYD